MKDAWFWGAPWLTFNLFPILVALSSSRGDADRSLKLASPGGCTVSTMDLSEAHGLWLFLVIRGGCVKKTRNRHAVRKMEVDPPGPFCRRRLQTALSCYGPMTVVVNVKVKRRGKDHVMWGLERRAQANLWGKASKQNNDDIKTGVHSRSREQYGRRPTY